MDEGGILWENDEGKDIKDVTRGEAFGRERLIKTKAMG